MVNIPGFATGPISNTALPVRTRSKLLDGANGGVLGLWDASYWRSYAGAESGRGPLAGETIKDIATIQWDGTQSSTAHNGTVDMAFEGGLPSYSGNMLDYSTSTAIGCTVSVAGIAEAVLAQEEQYWAHYMYVRLPTKEDWTSRNGIHPISCYTTHADGFTAEPDLLTIALVSTSGVPFLRAVRTTSAGVYEQRQFTPFDAHFGNVSQIMWRREDDDVALQLRTVPGGIQVSTPLNNPGVKTTQDLTGKKRRTGLCRSFWPGAVPDVANFGVGREWTEPLELSGRDARTVADQDWTRVMARPAHVAFS